jgi:hypothetical protein
LKEKICNVVPGIVPKYNSSKSSGKQSIVWRQRN